MQGFRYLETAVTLELDAEKCSGCRVCTVVCPHGVFAMGADKRAYLADRGAWMECGACALNCAWGAISVTPGVGCAEAIIHSWIYGGEPSCGCSAVPGAAGASAAGASAAGASVGGASNCCGDGAAELPANEAPSCCGSAPTGGDAPSAGPA